MGKGNKDKKASSGKGKDREVKQEKTSVKSKTKSSRKTASKPDPDPIAEMFRRTEKDEIPPGEAPGTDKADPTNISDELRRKAKRKINKFSNACSMLFFTVLFPFLRTHFTFVRIARL